MGLTIINAVKNVMFGPPCPLCNGRKNIVFKEKHYCKYCDSHILDAEILRNI